MELLGPVGVAVDGEDPRVAAARYRWRAAGDRLWPVALSDGETYRVAAQVVGELVEALRAQVGSLEALVDVDAAPDALLAGLGAAGERAAARPDLLAAACAVVGDELAARRARERRAARIARARADGDAWVEVDRTATRVVEMHLATGEAVVATADPYLGDWPFRVAGVVLDAVTGEPRPEPDSGPDGPDGPEAEFGTAQEWGAERERRRREIAGRLDTHRLDGSDS